MKLGDLLLTIGIIVTVFSIIPLLLGNLELFWMINIPAFVATLTLAIIKNRTNYGADKFRPVKRK